MSNDLNLSHSRWECKYQVVWIPKYRRKTIYGQLRKYLFERFTHYKHPDLPEVYDYVI